MNLEQITKKYGESKLNAIYDKFFDFGEVWMADYIITNLTQDDLEFFMGVDVYEVMKTNEGFLAYNMTTDEYLLDDQGNNTFETEEEAQKLIDAEKKEENKEWTAPQFEPSKEHYEGEEE